ncbi:ATP12 family chaperone protein [Chthonobacter rhizosphaerae]|uniref:ATP12 family chaperone protein n=1 Tax=Chthonobacter rhizosphaerae TaxID=2735553 RepID=UPI0015EFA17A|nr:ATP12 family protein [Chthonobacter rhizosphaerae]
MPDLFDDLAGPTDADRDRASTERRAAARELPKRFYKEASVTAGEGGFAVQLDGRPVRTPARRTLFLPTEALAAAVAKEWADQGLYVDPGTMHLTRLANSAIDGVADQTDAVADDVAKYAGSDLLFYRADGPERLVERQTELWDPIVAWGEQRFGVRLRLAEGVMPVEQDAAVLAAVRNAVPRDPFVLSGLHAMTTLMGSVLLAFAVLERRIGLDEAWTAAHVDEDWNIELWGEDEEAAERRAYRRAEFAAAASLAGL